MKKSILFLLALFSVTMTIQAAYYYRGDKNSWGNGIQLTQSADGYYYYYEATAGAHNFKILNSATSWSATQWNENNILSLYNGTDVAVTKAGSDQNIKCSATTKHYILFYPKNTKLNGSTKDYVCASKTLPNGFGEVHFKHPWNGGSWIYQTATNNGDGTFSFVGKYGGAGVNWCVQKNGTGEKYIATPTLVGSPVTGDDCTFTFNGADQTITIAKKENKNIGDITITMNCNQQPKIFFWDVEGKTCAAWPGEDMVAAGANTYTYTFEDVDVDLGVNYKINLKAVNENEWASGDLNAKADVNHDASILNITSIAMHGNFSGGWKDSEYYSVNDENYNSATLKMTIEKGNYEFGMRIGAPDNWTSNGKTFTRTNSSYVVTAGGGNLKLTADMTGEYEFKWTYKTNTLEIVFPEEEVVVSHTYTVVGSSPELFTNAWSPAETANNMEKQTDGSYVKVYNNIELTSDVQWKIAMDGTWWTSAPAGVNPTDNSNNVLSISESGIYDVTFTLSADVQTATATAKLIQATATVADCYISGNAALTGGEGWKGNEFKMEDYDSATKTYSYTLTGLATDKAYELKVVLDGNWYGFTELVNPAPANVSKGTDNAIAFKMAAAGDVVVTYNKDNGINLTGNFAAPVTYDYYIAGTLAGGWSATQQGMAKEDDVYKHTFSELNAGTYEFKITDGQFNSADDNTHEHTTLGAAYEEVSYNEGNIKIDTDEAINLTVIFDAANDKITFEGLTPVTVTPVTAYNVTVPAGTEKCYIVGAFAESNWNTFIEMDKVAGEDNKFTIEVGAGKKIAEATTVTEYKYARDTNFDNVEKDENGEEISNRTWSDNDIVASWAAPAETHTYTVAGSATLFGEDWDNTINEMTLQDDGTYVWTATGVTLSESVEFKVIEDQNWDKAWPANNYVIEIGEDKANTPGIYDVNIYFNAAEAKADNTTGIYVQLTPATIEIAEYMDITMTNLQTEDHGGILALMGSEEVLGLSVQLFLNDYTGADKEYELNEASYLAMVSGWMETELPFVSGSMTKSTDATYGDKFAGTVIVYMDDKYIGLNITMYKKPLSKVDLTITGANVVIDLWNGVKISTTHDSKPVLVEFSSFEYTANNKYYDAAFEMGDWDTDDTYFRAFAAEADVTISGNTLTLKGSFEAADAIYNLTISGAMPLVVTEGDNTNLLAQNGQTADAYITRTFESGNLYTVSFPFAMNETTTKNVFGSRVEVYEYTSLTEETDGLVLNFTKLSTPQIAAGTPYLVKPNKNAYGFGLSDVTISNAINTVTHTCASTTIAMEPVLTAAAKATTNGKTQYWLAEDNNLYNKSVNLKGLRAIFNVQTNKSNVRARAAFNENVETGVEDIFSTDAPVKVIVNGQLIIIRDGEMYNVQGQLVK